MIKNKSTGRSIKDSLGRYKGSMTEQVKQWWEGLAKELEVDIESLDESN